MSEAASSLLPPVLLPRLALMCTRARVLFTLLDGLAPFIAPLSFLRTPPSLVSSRPVDARFSVFLSFILFESAR